MKDIKDVKIFCIRGSADEPAIVKNLCDLDKRNYQSSASDDFGTEEYWMEMSKSAFRFVALLDGEPISYVDFLALNEIGEKTFLAGKLRDGRLADFLDPSPVPGDIILYITSLVTDKPYRKLSLVHRLFKCARSYFDDNGYKIKKIYSTAWSTEGEIISQKRGAKVVSLDTFGHKCTVMIPTDQKIPLLDR